MLRRAIGLSVLSLFLLSAASAQDNLFTPHHVSKLKVVTSAVISPDGSQVAYVLAVPRNIPKEKDGPSWTELHVVDLHGVTTPYLTGAVNVDAITWTPDGKDLSLLMKRDKDEHKSLYIMPLKGGEARKALTHSADILSFSWSPDGKSVAFLAQDPMPKDQKAREDQGFNQEIYEEEVRPVKVWIAKLDDGKGDKPAGSPAEVRALKLNGSASELHWSPRSDWIAVALAPTALIDDSYMLRKVHLVNVGTGESIQLDNPGKMGQLAWSSDGAHVALISGEDKHDPKEGRLWVHGARRGSWKDVLPKFMGHVESIAWKSPNTVIYQASEGVWTTIGTVEIQSSEGGVSFKEKKTIVPAAGPILEKLTASRDGKVLAFTGQSPNHPPEVYVLGPDDKAPRKLTDSNPWLRMMRFAEQEVVRYKARDGLELQGILVRPLDEKKGKSYPMVMTVHGGPEAHVSNGWSTMYHSLGQVGAARGIAVFYPNYRGSTGRGVEFSELGQAKAAKEEFDDLVDAIDHLARTGLVDAKKVGITGGSYGGYATAWGATYYSDRYAAGVMFVGISNNVSKVGTTDIPLEMNLVHHRKWLWEDWDYFVKSSPIYYLERAKTPLLILHGKNDPRVHPSQSLELYRHLKLRGKAPVRLVLYPGEGHGNRRAASKLDYNLRLLQWMEHYLKGPGGAAPPPVIEYGLPTKTKGTTGWHIQPLRTMADVSVASARSSPWIGGRCPCCIEAW